MKRRPDETDASYIARLEASNAGLRAQGKWAQRTSKAVTWLACDASLAFQAMAELAGVRAHPSVSAAITAFDTIAHPQWTEEDATVSFPTDWNLQPVEGWSGDADMELNAGIAKAIVYLRDRIFARGLSADEREAIYEIIDALERPVAGMVDRAIPDRLERKPVEVRPDATREELVRAINDLSWRALDLAQDMETTNTMLRRDLRSGAYRAVARDLYALANLTLPERNDKLDVKVIGDVEPF